MTRLIALSKGKSAIVDAGDYHRINYMGKWHYSGRGYAARSIGGRKSRRLLLMHRVIMRATSMIEVDHINGNTLDNRRLNLRFATRAQNCQNTRKVGKRSRFKGVWPNGPGWCAMIKKNGIRQYLGQFVSEAKAARAYNIAATELFGEYAKLNQFP